MKRDDILKEGEIEFDGSFEWKGEIIQYYIGEFDPYLYDDEDEIQRRNILFYKNGSIYGGSEIIKPREEIDHITSEDAKNEYEDMMSNMLYRVRRDDE
ncbi:MAG: hypothetical protein E7254_06480 [Lachnospiraceae bacterium]|nr:hypothetical protein [Lachnospiraceae bacterium]